MKVRGTNSDGWQICRQIFTVTFHTAESPRRRERKMREKDREIVFGSERRRGGERKKEREREREKETQTHKQLCLWKSVCVSLSLGTQRTCKQEKR